MKEYTQKIIAAGLLVGLSFGPVHSGFALNTESFGSVFTGAYEAVEGTELVESFEDTKPYIIQGLEYERDFVQDTVLRNTISETIEKLQQELQDEVFYDTLDDLYGDLDEYYQANSSLFEDFGEEMIEVLYTDAIEGGMMEIPKFDEELIHDEAYIYENDQWIKADTGKAFWVY